MLEQIKKQDFSDCALIIFRGAHNKVPNIMKGLRGKCPDGTYLICLTEDESIEVLSEEEMNKVGWYKK